MNQCYGGFPRIATLVKRAKSSSTPTLFLNAGDTYSGSKWFDNYKWEVVAHFLKLLSLDAMVRIRESKKFSCELKSIGKYHK